jgi:2-phosphosulfolactate phosphatase
MGSASILIGGLVNRAAICAAICQDDTTQQVDIICAGTNGEFSMEDALAAGAIVDGLLASQESGSWNMNDGTQISQTLWRADQSQIERSLARSRGGRNLIDIGMQDDLKLAAALDSIARAPSIDKSVWEIC